MIGLSDSTTVTFSVVGLLLALGILVLIRTVLIREAKPNVWRKIRVGLFIERETDEKDPPT